MFKYLSAASILVTLALCGCSSDSGESPNSAGSSNGGGSTLDSTESTGASCGANRQKLTCAEIKTKIEEDSKSVDFEVKVALGPWTDVPDALKVLPDGAELCGAVDLLNQGLVASNLDCDELRDYYRGVFEDDLGCKPFTCETETRGSQAQLRCSCDGADYHLGQLVTSPDTQYYLLSY